MNAFWVFQGMLSAFLVGRTTIIVMEWRKDARK